MFYLFYLNLSFSLLVFHRGVHKAEYKTVVYWTDSADTLCSSGNRRGATERPGSQSINWQIFADSFPCKWWLFIVCSGYFLLNLPFLNGSVVIWITIFQQKWWKRGIGRQHSRGNEAHPMKSRVGKRMNMSLPPRRRMTRDMVCAFSITGMHFQCPSLRVGIPKCAMQFFSSVHKQRDSLFSSTSGFTDYRGFLNLAIVLLVHFKHVETLNFFTIKFSLHICTTQRIYW